MGNWKIREVREEAVDETVVALMRGNVELYSNALLMVARQVVRLDRRVIGLLGIFGTRGLLRRRVENLLSIRQPAHASNRWGRLGIVALLGMVILPMSQSRADRDSNLEAVASGSAAASASTGVSGKAGAEGQSGAIERVDKDDLKIEYPKELRVKKSSRIRLAEY